MHKKPKQCNSLEVQTLLCINQHGENKCKHAHTYVHMCVFVFMCISVNVYLQQNK